ncbi:hypothetical protein D915_010056 [Fasciola hepatica]|uniref:RING-type E3 ubiquitin transferase n=1 Tax=Fasciola hepatica TaxID=6192 RepID=A0A4E0RCY0_FASHE|nr:hypothetical protein D915_010056 [Fasciola hepatica]
MGQQYSAIYRYVIRTIDRRLTEMNISKLSLSPRDLFLLRRHSCVLVLQYLKYSRQSELKELRVQHINDDSFTPDEIQSIDRIVRTMIFRCHRRSNQRYSRQSELKELRVQHINDDSFTPDEIQSIDRIVRTMIFRCHRRSNQRRTALGSQSSPNSRSPTRTPPLAEMFPNMRERSFSTPNLGPLDGPNNEIHDENSSRIPDWALVTRLAAVDMDRSPKCTICLIQFQKGDMLLTMPCFHLFHEFCAISWLRTQMTCPVCQTNPKEAIRKQSSITPRAPVPAYY